MMTVDTYIPTMARPLCTDVYTVRSSERDTYMHVLYTMHDPMWGMWDMVDHARRHERSVCVDRMPVG